MKNLFPALCAVFLLNGCAAHQPKPEASVQPQSSAMVSNLSKFECSWMPATQFMFGAGYQELLSYESGTEWFYPLFVGAASVSWAVGAPIAPAVDLLTAPLHIAQSCPKAG